LGTILSENPILDTPSLSGGLSQRLIFLCAGETIHPNYRLTKSALRVVTL
jgi:hypothetical protein